VNSSAPHHEADDLSPAELQAADWALRRRSALSPAAAAALQAWLDQSPLHGRLLEECEAASAQLDRLGPARRTAAPRAPARVAFRIAAGMAAVIALSATLFWTSRPDPLNYTAAAATTVGKFKRLTLPDGSRLTLNTDSAVEVSLEPQARRVRLVRGEAYFEVAAEPDRPFQVEAAQVRVRAVGTAFNVRYRPEKVEVTVTEGRIALDDAAGAALALAGPPLPGGTDAVPPATIAAGVRATVALTASGAPAILPVNLAPVPVQTADNALAWQSGRLEFSETPLADVVAEFNRYNRHQIVIEDPSLATRTFGGAFACHGYASFIEVLERSFEVTAERRGNVTVLRHRR